MKSDLIYDEYSPGFIRAYKRLRKPKLWYIGPGWDLVGGRYIIDTKVYYQAFRNKQSGEYLYRGLKGSNIGPLFAL